MESQAPPLLTVDPLAKKAGFRRQLSGLWSRSELSLKELQNSRNEDKSGPSLVGETIHQNYSMGKRRKERRKQRTTEGAREKDVSPAHGKHGVAESPTSKRLQKSASKTHSLSSSEPSLWRNSLLNKFRNFAWHKRRSSHLELSKCAGNAASDSWPSGRLQRPAVGSNVDMRSRPDLCPPPQEPEKGKLSSQSSEVDSVWTGLVPSISLDSLYCWADKSFSIGNSSLDCPTASEVEAEVLRETSQAPEPLSDWVENMLEEYFTSEMSLPSAVWDSENLRDRAGLREPQQFGGATGLWSVVAGPHAQWPPSIAEDVKTSPARNASKIRYKIMITMTKKEEEEEEAKPTAGCGEQGPPCHPSGKAALSLGVAELEKTEGQRHQKPARPASRLSACKEFQDCTGLHGVETCQACSLIATPATECLAVPWGPETSRREGEEQKEADQRQSRSGMPAEGPGKIALGALANSFHKSRGTTLGGNNKQLQRQRGAEIGRDLLCLHPSMEKVANGAPSCPSRPRGHAPSPPLRQKKIAPDSLKKNVKTPFGKVSAASLMVEGEGLARSSSPSRVSKLLEAWEKGLVGMDVTDPAPSAETRPSRSPIPTRRLLSAPDGAHSSHPANSKNSVSPSNLASVDAKRCLSPANARQSHSPARRRQSPFSEDARQSSPPDPQRPSGAAESQRSHSPGDGGQPPSLAPTQRPLSPAKARQTQVPRLPADSSHSHSPVGRRYSPSRTENQSSSSLEETQHSSSLSENRSSYSVADMRRFYSGGSIRQPPSPTSSMVETRRPFTPADSRSVSPSSDARSSPSPIGAKRSSPSSDTRCPSPPPVNGCSSSSTSARCSASPAEVKCLPPPPDATFSSSQADRQHSSSQMDAEGSPALVECRSFSPTAVEGCSCSLGPQRNSTAHGPVFAQVYSRLPKPKDQLRTEAQDGKSTRVTESPGTTLCRAAVHRPGDAGFQKESHITNTDGLQEEKNLAVSPDSIGGTVSQKESHMLNGDCSKADTRSLRETKLPGAIALRSSVESSPPHTLNTTSFSGSPGGNRTSSATSTKFSEEPRVFKPVPRVVCSSTIAESQTQWCGPKGGSVVVLRAKQQVIVPQPGCSTIYQAGREIILSAPGSANPGQGWQEKSLAPSSTTSAPLEEHGQSQADLPDAESRQRIHASFPKSCIRSMPEPQRENGMTHSRNASVRDAQRPRCVLVPSPACTSSREATIVREGGTPFSTPQRGCSLPSKSASQKHSNLFSGSRSEPEQGMPNAGGPRANGSDQESSLLGVGKASLTASRRNTCPLDTAGETGISAAFQQTPPGNHEARTQDELKKEQQTPGKGSPVFAPEQKGPPDGTLTCLSLPEPPSGNTRSSNQAAGQEPEEVEMEHFVDTLRNMDPAELRKPSKVLPRPPRPSILAKPKGLPSIDENHITPESKVPLPAALGELFVLTEENSEEGTGPNGEEPGWAEEEEEEIENPYLSKEDKSWDCNLGRTSYSWENQQYKTEEEIGAFLGKLQRSPGDSKANVIAPKAIANQTNLIRSNILKGTSLFSNFVDRRVVEDKPYSRLDNSFLYSKFISPEKAEFKAPTKRKGMSSFVQKISRECQTSANGPQENAVHKELPPAALHFRAPDTNGISKQIILLSKEAETLTQSEIQEEEKKPLKINKRPSKIILYSEAGFGGQKREIWSDVPDATSWELASTISIQVVRGGWLMYEKPRFHGRKCVLAEGNVEITNPWRMYCKKESERENAPFHIGSLKRVVQDYRLPEISFFSEENGEGRKQRFTDSAEDSRTYGRPLKAASIIVHSGLWLVYSKPFFDDDPYVLEPGGYPSLQAWGAKDPSICSMHPIKLGSPVVENPAEPKALIFERPHFQGHSWEVSRDIYNLKKPENNQDSMMSTAGSLKITGGCWVGYEKEGFRGHQYLLEEGEYCDWTEWGGYNEELVSLRLIRTDFLDPALVLFEAMDFEDGPSVELSEPLPDVELASYGNVTQSIHVLSGVWVAYEGKNFSGEQYILEKGVYRSCEDWGASNCQIASVQPVQQVGERNLHFISEIQLFSDPDLLGNSMTFKEDQASLPENFTPLSCRVNGGSWILYDDHQFDGEQHVLSEGEYPTLTSMGCTFTTAIHSLKKVPIFFSEPSIFLHGLECFEGKEIELNSEMRSLKAEGFNNHVLSVRVKGGIWVLCEHSDFRGRQWLLDCMEITNWLTYSGIQHIGSLYPIKQRRIYFRIKNQELKSFLSVPDDVEDMKAGRVLVSELNDKNSCIWYYEEGLMKNQAAPNMSLQVIGQAGKGTKVVLWSESRMPRQTWRIDSFGRICSQMFDDKVLDVKGGRTYDRDHAVLWESSEERPTQIWDVELL